MLRSMLAWSLRFEDRIDNEFHAFIEVLKEAGYHVEANDPIFNVVIEKKVKDNAIEEDIMDPEMGEGNADDGIKGKDKKAMNILFNGVDGDMFDNIINFKTAKDVWDTIQIICDGTEQVRENKMQLLIQQYEHFHNEESESLTDIFSRFQKLLNALKLHGRIYQTKDSNLKLFRSLPKKWKPMTVSLRNSQDYKEFTLERLYGILKTYELEIEQDERMERGKKKGGSIALVVELEKEKEVNMEAVESTSRVFENKVKGLAVESEDSLSQDDIEDIDEHLAFLSRRFSKLKFKKNFGAAKPNRNMVDKSKFKCFKCGLAGHFASECRKSDSSKKKFEPVDYKQKYFELLKQKERAFITQENDWAADGLDEDEDVSYVNLALMAKSYETETSSSSNQLITTNLAHLSKAECNDAINDMSTELYHFRVTLKSLNKENAKIKENTLFLSERNNVLESQFIDFKKLRIECKIAKEELTEDVHAQITKVQGIESFCDEAWKKNKEKLEPNLVDGVLTDVDSTDDEDHPSDNKKCYPSKDENPHPLAVSKPINKAKLVKLNEKYGMPQMPFSMPYWNNIFTHSMPFPVSHNIHDNSVAMNGFKGTTQMTKDESEIPKSNEIKPKKQKKKANKSGPKETWVPKST
ncbi:hypothetical protein AgCh_013981 [Apium graveolens]